MGIVLGAIGLIGGGVYAGVKSSQAGNTGWDLVGNIASQNFANQVHYGEIVRAILYYPGMRETAIWFSE